MQVCYTSSLHEAFACRHFSEKLALHTEHTMGSKHATCYIHNQRSDLVHCSINKVYRLVYA